MPSACCPPWSSPVDGGYDRGGGPPDGSDRGQAGGRPPGGKNPAPCAAITAAAVAAQRGRRRPSSPRRRPAGRRWSPWPRRRPAGQRCRGRTIRRGPRRPEVAATKEESGGPDVIAADEEAVRLEATALRPSCTPRSLPLPPRSLCSMVAVVFVPSATIAVVQAKPDARTTAQNAGETSRSLQSR